MVPGHWRNVSECSRVQHRTKSFTTTLMCWKPVTPREPSMGAKPSQLAVASKTSPSKCRIFLNIQCKPLSHWMAEQPPFLDDDELQNHRSMRIPHPLMVAHALAKSQQSCSPREGPAGAPTQQQASSCPIPLLLLLHPLLSLSAQSNHSPLWARPSGWFRS